MHTAYDGIYEELKEALEQGVYAYKDYLPSESVLVKHFGCAHNTVRKALAILTREGYVQPIHGKGVRVIYRSTPMLESKSSIFEPRNCTSFKQVGKRSGFDANTKVFTMETLEVDKELAAQTGFDEGNRVVHMERVRYCDGKALARDTNYFRADVVQGMTQFDAEQSVYDYIEKKRGVKLVTRKYVISIDRASERDLELLDLENITWVANMTSAVYDGAGLLCEVTIVRHHPDYFSYSGTTFRTRIGQE